jgi:flagellar export protein FliJ
MPFRFTLAAVLLVRESAEKREDQALQKIQFEMARALRELEELSAQIANEHTAREQAMQRPIPAVQLHSFLTQAHQMAEKKKALLARIEILKQERDLQMKAYQAAHRDRETLTGMFNDQRDAYEQERARRQQKQLDDIFMARRHRS